MEDLYIYHVEADDDANFPFSFPVNAVVVAETIEEAKAIAFGREEKGRKCKVIVIGVAIFGVEKGVFMSASSAWAG